jgi:site-specific DNA-methyltransferase (adenine-specific)
MKGNDGTGDVIERDEWETPQWLYAILHKQYEFNFDCCASSNNSKCNNWSEQDFLDYDDAFIDEVHWMNPPFSKAKEMFEHFFKVVGMGVAIYRCDNFETKIWQEVIFPNASWVFIPDKRIAYEGLVGGGSRFPSALIGFNVSSPKNVKGFCLEVIKQC